MLWQKQTRQIKYKRQYCAPDYLVQDLPVWEASLFFQCFYSDGVTYRVANWDSHNVTLNIAKQANLSNAGDL